MRTSPQLSSRYTHDKDPPRSLRGNSRQRRRETALLPPDDPVTRSGSGEGSTRTGGRGNGPLAMRLLVATTTPNPSQEHKRRNACAHVCACLHVCTKTHASEPFAFTCYRHHWEALQSLRSNQHASAQSDLHQIIKIPLRIQ